MKFSLIIPVYNVEKYIIRCLESINKQTYNNYEVIIVNDGSPDKSEKLITKFIKNKPNFKLYCKENGGLSDARNYGVQFATGDYILYIDSDDYIEEKLLEKINKELKQKIYDLVRYELNVVNDNRKIINKPSIIKEKSKEKKDIVEKIVSSEYVEPAWLYAYNLAFWKTNNFMYPKGRIHEDFGLTPIIISKAQNIKTINYRGYNYVQRENSIMNQVSYEKLFKRTTDFIEEYLLITKEIKKQKYEDRLILNYCTSAVIYKLREINKEDRLKALKKLKTEEFLKNYSIYNLKTFIIKLRYKLFLNGIIEKSSKEFYKNMEG